MKNLKDTLTTIAGVMIAIAGVILALSTNGIILPTWVTTGGVVLATVGAAIIAYLGGKNPDGSTKSKLQVENQNKQSKVVDN